MTDPHIDDVAAVDTLVGALLRGRFTGEDDGPARRALLDHMASLRASTAHWASEFRRVRDEKHEATDAFVGVVRELDALRTPRPRDEWKESDGTVLWWRLPVEEPPYVGDLREDDFPDDVTHWTPIPNVKEPDVKEKP